MAGIGSSARGLTFSISAPGVAPLTATLSRFATEVSDFRPFWNGAFKQRWRELMLAQFRSEGAATGGRWAPLSPGYAAWKSARFGSQGILVRYGALSSSLINAGTAGGAGSTSIWRATPTSLDAGTSARGALFHQKGTRRLPARPPLRFTADFGRVVAKDLQMFVAAAWKARRQEQAGA